MVIQMKYVYPAIFRQGKDKIYLVSFPDLDGCFTDGETLADAKENAADVLNLKLWDLEEKREAIPTATNPQKIKTAKNDFVFQVSADTVAYRKLYDK